MATDIPAGFTFEVIGSNVFIRGDGPVMPGEILTFRFSVQLNSRLNNTNILNEATITAADTVSGDSIYQRDHSGAVAEDTLSVRKPPLPPLPPIIDPVGPDDGGSSGIDETRRDEVELWLLRELDEMNIKPELPVNYLATGVTVHGATVDIKLYSETGALVGVANAVADTGGNWLISFQELPMGEKPYRIEVNVTPPGLVRDELSNFATRAYYTPALIPPHFMYRGLAIDDISATIAPESMDSLSLLGGGQLSNDAPIAFLGSSSPQKL